MPANRDRVRLHPKLSSIDKTWFIAIFRWMSDSRILEAFPEWDVRRDNLRGQTRRPRFSLLPLDAAIFPGIRVTHRRAPSSSIYPKKFFPFTSPPPEDPIFFALPHTRPYLRRLWTFVLGYISRFGSSKTWRSEYGQGEPTSSHSVRKGFRKLSFDSRRLAVLSVQIIKFSFSRDVIF